MEWILPVSDQHRKSVRKILETEYQMWIDGMEFR